MQALAKSFIDKIQVTCHDITNFLPRFHIYILGAFYRPDQFKNMEIKMRHSSRIRHRHRSFFQHFFSLCFLLFNFIAFSSIFSGFRFVLLNFIWTLSPEEEKKTHSRQYEWKWMGHRDDDSINFYFFRGCLYSELPLLSYGSTDSPSGSFLLYSAAMAFE